MFTGIIETLGKVVALEKGSGNLSIWVESSISHELKIDQSLSHNGVCLTVVEISGNKHKVVAIEETLNKSNLGEIKNGDKVNLERCMLVGSRYDGHIVQGHVDQVGICTGMKTLEGSWIYDFEYEPQSHNFTVEKGSISVNGTSLTVVNSKDYSFSVAIIPYTYENTIFHQIKRGDRVNLEFDILGKYISKIMERQSKDLNKK
jgi:riboflavin synthase